jgi:hypothetical protein
MPPRIRFFVVILVAVSSCPAFAQVSPNSSESIRSVVSEWAKVRAETIRLKSQWEWERELLGSTLTALEERVRALEDKKQSLSTKNLGEQGNLNELVDRNTHAQAALSAADKQLKRLTEQLIVLRASLPPRLSVGLEMAYRSLANESASSSERMQYVMMILSRCAQFNQTITSGDEALRLPGEPNEKVLETIYFGLASGYAVDRAHGKAYIGAPAEKGWAWEASAESAKAIGDAISIYHDKGQPDFVELPAQIAHPASKPSS